MDGLTSRSAADRDNYYLYRTDYTFEYNDNRISVPGVRSPLKIIVMTETQMKVHAIFGNKEEDITLKAVQQGYADRSLLDTGKATHLLNCRAIAIIVSHTKLLIEYLFLVF